MGFLSVNFQFPAPFRSRLRVRYGTERQWPSTYYVPPYGGGDKKGRLKGTFWDIRHLLLGVETAAGYIFCAASRSCRLSRSVLTCDGSPPAPWTSRRVLAAFRSEPRQASTSLTTNCSSNTSYLTPLVVERRPFAYAHLLHRDEHFVTNILQTRRAFSRTHTSVKAQQSCLNTTPGKTQCCRSGFLKKPSFF